MSEEREQKDAQAALLGALPQIGRLLEQPEVKALCEDVPRALVTRCLREEVGALREGILAGAVDAQALGAWDVMERLRARVEASRRGHLRRVLNGTGVIIHTNLGRAPLPQRALDRIQEVASGYCNLEYDLEQRRRGGRMEGVKQALCALTGAEAAHVVNNNAAAVMLALATMASGREVLISRSELVEIGGSFRVPDVMRAAGVTLREVGTTNRTHLRDYADAIGPQTGLLLKVHRSNFVIRGFTREVSLAQLVALGQEHGVPVMYDQGSGCFADFMDVWGEEEVPLRKVIASGLDVVTCSGDKLLGGPQAGMLLGRQEWIGQAAKQPIARALRVDKLTLGALEATLQVYREGVASSQIPVLRMLSRSHDALRMVGQTLLERLGDLKGLVLGLEDADAAVGGGTLPEFTLPTVRLVVESPHCGAVGLESWFRARALPVIGLLERGRLLLDLRTIEAEEIEELSLAFRELDAWLGVTKAKGR